MNKASLSNMIRSSAKKNNGGQLPDERQQLLNSTALIGALIFGIVFDLIMIVYYFVTKNMEMTYPYVAQLVVMGVGCFLASLGKKEAQAPTAFFGRRRLNTDKTGSAFFSRMAWCILDSLVFAIAITVFDAYADGNVTGSLIFDGIIAFCIFAIIEVIFCEIKVYRYRKLVAMLDAEENDLED